MRISFINLTLQYKALSKMKETNNYEQDLASIRQLMERSSRFISLSGLSGVFAGTYALIGAFVAYLLIYYPNSPFGYRFVYVNEMETLFKLLLTGTLVMGASIFTGIWFSLRKAKKEGLSYWDHNSKRFLINISIPLMSGGLFIFALILRGYLGFAAPATLIFYGLSLVNASTHTYSEIRYLGLFEVLLGLLCAFFPGYGLIFWSLGFGVLHIVYGTVMYVKYERN